VRVLIILAAICCISSCAALTANHSVERPEKEFQTAASFMKDKKYGEAVSLYRTIIADLPGTQFAADARYQIALAYAFSDNPDRDWVMAIQEFEKFLKLHPSDGKALEAQNWIAILKMHLELKKENELLRKEIDQFRKNIEELKQLDIRNEERRRK
jgi:outer membrane protein assembly factor BamD (BamD/ComL family)